jgi:hypothetical protein
VTFLAPSGSVFAKDGFFPDVWCEGRVSYCVLLQAVPCMDPRFAFLLFFTKLVVTSVGQEAKSTGYRRVNNSPTTKHVAKRQQTKQKSKYQLAAQGYHNAITMNLLSFNLQRKQS